MELLPNVRGMKAIKFKFSQCDERFRQDAENIIHLFYGEGDIASGDGEAVDLCVWIEVGEADRTVASGSGNARPDRGSCEARVRLSDMRGKSVTRIATRPSGEAKRAVNLALLDALGAYTGIEQPWGILTGVRPTKLYHRLWQQGKDAAAIASSLQQDYQISRKKINVMERIVRRQLIAVPDLYQLQNEVSLYIGIPFCPTKCSYCTFPAYAIQGRQGSVNHFLTGLEEEIRQIGSWLTERELGVTSIYFGGGTPTSISAEEMDRLFAAVAESFPRHGRSRELTVEAGRPDTITADKIRVMHRWGVDRISVNPQSFTQATLDVIGRHHSVEETVEKFLLAREMGMGNINMDLIVGLPGEGMEEFCHSLQMVQRLMPESLTVHTLSFKRASEMSRNRERYRVADGEEVARMVEWTEAWTEARGYEPYYLYRQKNILGNQENVGYALPGMESIYNIAMMEERQTILGLGCGAVSKIVSPHSGKITRFANPKDPKVYTDHFRQYLEQRQRLLDEAYRVPAAGARQG